MSITAKVKLGTKTDNYGADSKVLTFFADYANGRNKEWASATPTLQLTMAVRNDVAERFEVGQAYTLTFTPTED